MNIEALSGLVSAIDKPPSPHNLAQEASPQFQRFIDNRSAMAAEVLPSVFLNPVELYYDYFILVRDYYKSCQEYVKLKQDPIYLDRRVPHGDGSTLFYIGGLRTIPREYEPGVNAFREIGYNAKTLHWGVNTKPPQEMADACEAEIEEEVRSTGHKVILIGHSLGGFDELAMFVKNPERFVDLVEHVVFDASPRPTRINKAIGLAFLFSQLFSREINFEITQKAELLKKLAQEGILNVTSVDSSNDPVIQGQFFGRVKDHYIIKDASHAGLGYHPDFIRLGAFRFSGEEIDFGHYPNIHQLPQAA